MKRRTAWIVAAGVAAVAIGAAAVGALALVLRNQGGGGAASSATWTGGRSYLYLTLQDDIPEQPPAELPTFFERRPPSLRVLVDSIDRAATDTSVTALVLRVSLFTDSGWGKVQELRDAIGRFKKSGKPAYAYLEFAGNKEYYLATACTKVYALPTAILDVTGLRTETSFFANTLDKLGVDAQFVGVGKYKNAPNQFTESGFTPPHREQMESLLDSLYRQYVDGIREGRGKSAEEIQAIVDAGPYDGPTALKAGLVDELLYEDQLKEKLKGSGPLSPSRYFKSRSGNFFDTRPKLAVVYAVGEIVQGESQSGAFGGQVAGSDTIAAALREARNDDDVKAIVLRVDSPGGSGTASDVIWREVVQARKQKPVVVSFGDVAASGGYYVAMGADAIVAQPGTITGSIGVFSGKFVLKGLYDKLGITKELLLRGQHADIFSEYRPWDDAEKARMDELMVSFYRDFVTRVAQGRGKSFDEIDAVAQGRVWTGTEALAVGLVDRLGGLEEAVLLAKDRAKIARSQDVHLIVLPARKGLLETILERQEDSLETALPADIRALLRWAHTSARGGLFARLPYHLSVR